MVARCRLQRLTDASDHIPFTGEEGVDGLLRGGETIQAGVLQMAGEPQIVGGVLPDVNRGCRAIHIGHALAGRTGSHQCGPLNGDIGRSKAQGRLPRQVDGQKGDIPAFASGVGHHFTGGRIGDELGDDAPALRQSMAELGGNACRLAVFSRWASTALPRLMAKRSRDGVIADIADSCGG